MGLDAAELRGKLTGRRPSPSVCHCMCLFLNMFNTLNKKKDKMKKEKDVQHRVSLFYQVPFFFVCFFVTTNPNTGKCLSYEVSIHNEQH